MLHHIMTLDSIHDHGILYHYTKCHGAQGIITQRSIRATRSDFLNDTNEIYYILTVVQDVIGTIKEPKWRELLTRNILESTGQIRRNKYYVAAFSIDPDSITLWAEFGDTTGYNVGFDSSELVPAIEHNQPVSYHGYVIYSQKKQKMILEELLFQRIPEQLESDFQTTMANAVIQDEQIKDKQLDKQDEIYKDSCFRHLCQMFQKAVGVYALFFKQEEFAAEKEYRFVFKHKNNTQVQFREKDGFMMPYIMIALGDQDKQLPIQSMTVAPKNHIDLAREGMELYLQHHGYDVKVKLSRIKLRY